MAVSETQTHCGWASVGHEKKWPRNRCRADVPNGFTSLMIYHYYINVKIHIRESQPSEYAHQVAYARCLLTVQNRCTFLCEQTNRKKKMELKLIDSINHFHRLHCHLAHRKPYDKQITNCPIIQNSNVFLTKLANLLRLHLAHCNYIRFYIPFMLPSNAHLEMNWRSGAQRVVSRLHSHASVTNK